MQGWKRWVKAETHVLPAQDALFGVGILQVMIKHWYEGKYEPDAWAGWFFVNLGRVSACPRAFGKRYMRGSN